MLASLVRDLLQISYSQRQNLIPQGVQVQIESGIGSTLSSSKSENTLIKIPMSSCKRQQNQFNLQFI